MKTYSSFAKTCIGANHVRRGIVCQDSSIAVNKENYSLAAVADGHGSPQYLRTDKGSQLCIKSAVECVDEFMNELESITEHLACENERETILLQLWRSIVSRWHSYTEEDSVKNPFSEEEFAVIPESKQYYKERYKGGDYIKAYGTTLILIVITENFAFGLQIGDGKCVALDDNAYAWEPIPADSRCYDCVTTSMSQDDAILSGRFCYFDKKNIPPAIFLGSDGIDDSYGNDEMLYAFYRGLALTFAQYGIDEGTSQLEKFLTDMTRKGSGDDVSCVGIINLERLNIASEAYLAAVEKLRENVDTDIQDET